MHTVHESDQSQMNVKVDEIQISAQQDLEQSNAVVLLLILILILILLVSKL